MSAMKAETAIKVESMKIWIPDEFPKRQAAPDHSPRVPRGREIYDQDREPIVPMGQVLTMRGKGGNENDD